jgi:hypothetical protein
VSRWLPGLLLVAAGAAGAESRDALSALDTCIGQLDRGLDIGYARISARCPELTPSLLASPWAAWLPADWNTADNQLSAQGLSELRDLLGRETAPPAAGRPLHIERVGAVLARVTEAQPPRTGWWPRFKRWLRDLFTPRPSDERSWWRRLLGDIHLTQGLKQAIVWASLALVMALAVAVVLNELRLAGLLRRRQRVTPSASAADAGRIGLTLAEIERASLGEQPALLLDFIARRLVEQERLPPARAFTTREVVRRARLSDEADRVRLTELAAVCERVRFSGHAVAPQAVAAAVARGRELLSTLAMAAMAAPGEA